MNEQGISILTSVIVIMSVAISIATTLALLGSTDLETTFLTNQGELVRNTTYSCYEEAVFQLRSKSDYSGQIIELPYGECEIIVSDTEDAQSKKLEINVNSQGVIKKIEILGAVNGNGSGFSPGKIVEK